MRLNPSAGPCTTTGALATMGFHHIVWSVSATSREQIASSLQHEISRRSGLEPACVDHFCRSLATIPPARRARCTWCHTQRPISHLCQSLWVPRKQHVLTTVSSDRVGTDVLLQTRFNEIFSNDTVTVTRDYQFNLFRYAAEQPHKVIIRPTEDVESIKQVMFLPSIRKRDGDGVLVESVTFAGYQVAYEDVEFKVFVAQVRASDPSIKCLLSEISGQMGSLTPSNGIWWEIQTSPNDSCGIPWLGARRSETRFSSLIEVTGSQIMLYGNQCKGSA